MAAPIPDSRFIAAFSLETIFLDKDTGEPLAGGFLTFTKAPQSNIPKSVYRLDYAAGAYTFVDVGNIIELSAIGNIVDAFGNPFIPYFLPQVSLEDDTEQLYDIAVTSAGDVPQYVRLAQPDFGGSGDIPPEEARLGYQNVIFNPTFSQVLFDTVSATHTITYTAASSQPNQIADDWYLIVSGTGSIVLNLQTPIGSTNALENTPTVLEITCSGSLTSVVLEQRFYGSPNFMGGSGQFVSSRFDAASLNSSIGSITMNYYQSGSPGTLTELLVAPLDSSGTLQTFSDSAAMPDSTSGQDFPDAYVAIQFVLQVSAHIALTNVQVVPTGILQVDIVPYNQISVGEQVNHLFQYFQPQINYKPLPSYLAGWDFPLNPAQFNLTGTQTTTNAYIWDQTIGGATADVAYTRSALTGGLEFTTSTTSNAFYILQYLSGPQILEMIDTVMSFNLFAYKSASPTSIVTARVYLYAGNVSSTIPNLGTTIGTMTPDGVFTLTDTTNWKPIPRGELGPAIGELTGLDVANKLATTDYDLPFPGWQMTDTTMMTTFTNFACVVTFAYDVSGTVITVNSGALVPGNIPTRPAPKTLNETLADCQYYYRKSFPYGVIPANNAGLAGSTYGIQVVGASQSGAAGPIINFDKPMRVTPTRNGGPLLYNPSANNSNVRDVNGNDWNGSAAAQANVNGFITTGNTNSGSSAGDSLAVQWTADARFGIAP